MVTTGRRPSAVWSGRQGAQGTCRTTVSTFEDAVQIACAFKVGCDTIETRNNDDFKEGGMPVEEPGVILARLKALP